MLGGVLITVIFLIVVALAFFQPRWLLTYLAKRCPEVLFAVPTKERVVALTIDDAPTPWVTSKILDILRAHDAHATFFVIGDHVSVNEAVLARAKREGNELGNHLAHEYPSIRLDKVEFARQLAAVDQLISPPVLIRWFRPGSGWFNERILAQARDQGYRCALGSVYPFDPWIRNASLISWYILGTWQK